MNLAMLDSNNMQSMLFFVNFADFITVLIGEDFDG